MEVLKIKVAMTSIARLYYFSRVLTTSLPGDTVGPGWKAQDQVQ